MPGPPTTPLPPSTASQEALSGEPHRVPVLQVRGLGLSRATGGGSVCDATTLQCGLPAVVTQRKNEPLVKGLVNFYKATRKVLVPAPQVQQGLRWPLSQPDRLSFSAAQEPAVRASRPPGPS